MVIRGTAMDRYIDEYDMLKKSSETFRQAMDKLNMAVMTDPRIIDDSGVPRFVLTKLTNHKRAITVRDSILYRAESILHHTALLIREYNNKLSYFNEMQFNERLAPQIRHEFAQNLQLTTTFYSEDVIVNIITLFDYIANFFGYWKYGEHKLKIKWKGLMSCARNSEYEKKNMNTTVLAVSELGSVLQAHHNEYWKILEDYRGDIVHNHMHGPSSRVSINIMEGHVDVKIFAPKGRIGQLAKLSGCNETEEMDYIEAIVMLANNGFVRLFDIVNQMHNLHDYNAPFPRVRIMR
ncbi:MAG: hypothetical protein CL946_12500 [Ectothiorhodospiraceae bacterium]|nr:hypothetical protein [Ectothiorhodospiraceae bacterium]